MMWLIIRLFIYPGPKVVIIACFFVCAITRSTGQEVISYTPRCDAVCGVRRNMVDCEHSSIETISQVRGCNEVSRLEIGFNRITSLRVSDPLPTSNQLTYVDFTDNPITDIEPGWFANNPQIEEIYLNMISLRKLLNSTFSELHSLRTLHFWGGRLRELEEYALAGLSSLKDINFSLNDIRSLPEDLFYETINLEVVSLSLNKLAELPSRIFSNSPHLKIIELASNRLSSIPSDIFMGLSALEKVDLKKNNLVELPLLNVKFLDLVSNQLTSLPFPDGEIKWEEVRLHHNPLHCDYTIEPLRNWYECQINRSCNGTAIVDRWLCSTPMEYQHFHVGDLPAIVTTTAVQTTRPITNTDPVIFVNNGRDLLFIDGRENELGQGVVDSSSFVNLSSHLLTIVLTAICLLAK
ncbi:hypothetical protein BSL78_24305 [Apostichopus japonicus]|uniref:Uncharacterized protein n=1 Tax=Stichopus japonicus TaxID=307972 RepID=A0A2G8JSW6_STIJA|nr:hypothetical protein BSL78_24305 [Apostichopus japonicus]